MKISELKLNPKNPRTITKPQMEKLIRSIKDLPQMMRLRPIVIDKDNMILGGNMRYKALVEMGYEDIPPEWIVKAEDLSDKQKKEFIIKDNIGYGQWDEDVLIEEFDTQTLYDWGLPVSPKDNEAGAIQFSDYLDEEHNYVVLYFDNRIDWLQAQTHFELESVSAKRSNGKEWSKGIGRVLNGSNYLHNLKRDLT